MAKKRIQFECDNCGYVSPKWLGSCPSCSSWNTFVEKVDTPVNNDHKAKQASSSFTAKPVKLNEITEQSSKRIKSEISELDTVLGGGFMPGSFILLGGDPGIGKSTLTLQLANSKYGLNILYCSGEESEAQIAQRAKRLGIQSKELTIYTETDINIILEKAQELKPDLLIIDSIQTVFRTELSSMPGSVAQIRECAALLMRFSKEQGVITIAVGHMTKDGSLAGPRILEHMVDTVLMFEGDNKHSFRLLRGIKNRFGSTNEIGVFEMREDGLRDVINPSELFLPLYSKQVSGSAIVSSLEGTRPILLEVQALVTESSFGTPQRMASGYDQKRLALLLAVLEKRAGLFFGTKDVFVNIAGGMKIQDTSSDLGIMAALMSSLKDDAIPNKTVFIGEVGLGAEIRAVRSIESRINEALKLDFEKIIIPKAIDYSSSMKANRKIIEIESVTELFELLE